MLIRAFIPIRAVNSLKLHRLLKDTRGQFTIEASLTLPAILLATVLLIFLALYVYHQANLYQTAAVSANRTAYIWDNSSKDYRTGAVANGQTDGLYWRLTNDHLSNLFSFMLPVRPASVALPGGGAAGGSSPENKLQRTAGELPSTVGGELSYSNKGLLRYVEASLQKAAHLPGFAVKLWGEDEVQAGAQSFVVDPVETIRLTDLTRTFISEVQGRIKPKAALAAMVEPKGEPKEPVRITSHAQAANYLRLLVTGAEQVIQVDPQTKRTVDALDAGGVAHQAYYTFNEKNLREVQMPKDAELLKQGTQVRGVVWHFFKLSKADKVKLSGGLKAELERRGIVVVLHE
ncbi:TadE/TadG family type IV pilus assembly protein [Paenibacillus sp. KR2-11]|uniref:TadE/TadG family type IV pilus assembly protein n=1 Tax=Paenibacillus sp. KR2-11 TaxID=3385500 RepID=UPI0038FCDA15